ncbi:D-amino acid dehydrogenase [Neisseria shayeganii]|uniref:D-amino acid dehydrogenase n=1 Tax=Neisseria shayeganii TaxID=607712 RepID=A0A7D7NAZ4_9NEIS|nr:D-amino acid dehydrogenase [Neisseria shayeganii]QMT40175.1 D-amino acid dehydrogenase [Neisseria shayeganii]
MQVIVMGAGITGIATAWYLRQAGHEVTVIEREQGAALETSFANAGQLSYGYTTPWAAPGIPQKAAKWLFKEHSPLLLRPDGSLFQLQWLWQMLQNCTDSAYIVNKDRMVRISEYSREMLARLEAETGIGYEGRQLGTLQIFRTQQQIDAAAKDMQVLRDYGVPFELLEGAAACAAKEPALAQAANLIAGGLHLPNDGTGDCHLFTTRLAKMCADAGVVFHYGREIQHIATQGNRITGLTAGGEHFSAERYVCALGSFSRQLLAQLDIRLPVYPVKGYSLTIPMSDESRSPVSTIIDETYKVAITRFDERIRVGGMAELSGYRIQLSPKRRETLELVVNELFPGCGNVGAATFWSGLRPMTPDSTPIIGATRFTNLFTNTGHGTLGWTMGLGSGKITADLVGEVKPEIETSDLSLIRYA